jgi:hypothetical protein
MSRFDGSAARPLDFTPTAPGWGAGRVGLHPTTDPTPGGDPHLRLGLPGGALPQRARKARRGLGLRGPEKYKVLELRRRRAQITARRMLDLIDVPERAGRNEPAAMEEA